MAVRRSALSGNDLGPARARPGGVPRDSEAGRDRKVLQVEGRNFNRRAGEGAATEWGRALTSGHAPRESRRARTIRGPSGSALRDDSRSASHGPAEIVGSRLEAITPGALVTVPASQGSSNCNVLPPPLCGTRDADVAPGCPETAPGAQGGPNNPPLTTEEGSVMSRSRPWTLAAALK